MKIQKKFHKTLKNLSLSGMQPGQFLVNKDGMKRKIFSVREGIIIASKINNFEVCGAFDTEVGWKKDGWSLLEEPWVPKKGEKYFFVMSYGDIDSIVWRDTNEDKFRLSVGNVHRTTSDAKEYRQKLIEVMGLKKAGY